ncbi:MAG: FkbM family methyltransferase [Flavobacteriia bacterium]|jgi:FkbM family methyltransferase
MKKIIKKLLSNIFDKFGFILVKKIDNKLTKENLHLRPMGDMKTFIEDLKFRGLQCKNILDVGAFKAEWSTMVKQVFTESNFHLIEPLKELEPYLKDFCDRNEFSNYFINGAGSENQKLSIHVSSDFAGTSFLSNAEAGEFREINIIKIDDLISEHKIEIPELMKIDVQGYELEVLKGAQLTFGKTEVYIVEVSFFPFDDLNRFPLIDDVINYFSAKNYVMYDFPGFLRRPFDGALGQCDICFVKKDGFLRNSNKW